MPLRNKEVTPFEKVSPLAALAIGAGSGNAFHKRISSFPTGAGGKIAFHTSGKDVPNSLLAKLKGKDAVIVSLHDMSQFASKGYGLTQDTKDFVEALRKQTRVILVMFGNPYAAKFFENVPNLLVCYEEDDEVQDLAAQALFGVFPLRGKLPVTASPALPVGTGINTESVERLGYGVPEEVGMSSTKLEKVDELMAEAIADGATPGGVVLVARRGKIVFKKSYGFHTYDKNPRPTEPDDIWDLASITKVAASTISLMRLQEQGKFDPKDPVEKYLPEFASTNKKGIPLVEMMTHRGRLMPWIKFYENTITPAAKPSPNFYQNKRSDAYPLPVAKDLWLKAGYEKQIWQQIMDSPLEASKEYKYSDLGFYIAGEIVKRQSGLSVDEYASQIFYQPLGLQTMGYRPYQRFPMERIPPTENDDYFRDRRIQGYVHDMGAAMLDQATGHAGLFSDAEDLAVLMQMLLNKGSYGGMQYLKPETINYYTTRCQGCTRRGIGFDMFQKNTSYENNLSKLASDGTYGHLGFTGTAVWVDPAQELIYIFLSNRTFPSMKNNKLAKLNTRVRVQDAVYEAIID